MSSQKLTVEFLSNKLNIKPYNKLDKKVIDFKETKDRLVILCTIKCFYYQDGEDADQDKKHKTHI